jgi:hypothetical protein
VTLGGQIQFVVAPLVKKKAGITETILVMVPDK